MTFTLLNLLISSDFHSYIAKELSNKPEKAMKLTKLRIWEVFKEGMDDTFKKAKEYHRKSFRFDEPQKMSKKFLKN